MKFIDSEDYQAGIREGRDAALAFRCDPYRDLYQHVFKAETAEYKLDLSYDDPEGEYQLQVLFKRRYAGDGGLKAVTLIFTSCSEATDRALEFVTRHLAPPARCLADY